MCKENMKVFFFFLIFFFYEEDFIQETNLCYMDKANTTNITIHDLFLYFKICYVKKKIRSVSKEDTYQFFI